jgi:two-component system sporulation sensor kinase C
MSVRKAQNAQTGTVALRVLAVACDPSSRVSGLEAALKEAGATDAQIAAFSAPDAADALKKNSFDLIVLMDSPPECDALELLSIIHKTGVVVLTRHDDWGRVRELLSAGATEVVTPDQAAGGMFSFALQQALTRQRRRPTSSDEEMRKHRRAEAALRERNKQFRLALKNSPVAVWFQDLDLRYTWMFNPNLPITNLRDIIGRTDEEILGPESARTLTAIKRKALAEGIKIEREVDLSFGGQTTRYLLSVEPVTDEQGRMSGLICTSLDITQMRRTEEALRQANEKLGEAGQNLDRDMRHHQSISDALRKQAQLLDLAQDAIMVCDEEDRILYWNHGAEEMYGWKSNEAAGMIAYELLLTRFPASFENLKEILLNDGSYLCELEQTTRDGRRITTASRWVVRKNDGREVSFLQINRDITDHKRMEDALRESEEHFHAIFTESAIGIILEDTHGRIIEANPAIQRMLGYSLEDMRGLGVAGITHPDDATDSLRLLTEIEAETRSRQSVEKRYVHRDGYVMWGAVTLFGIRDARGRLRYVTAMIEDITQHKLAEEKLREASEQRRLALEAANLGTWEYNLQTGETSWDERARALFGVPEVEAITYDKLLSLVHADDRSLVIETFHQAAQPSSNGRHDVEFRVVWPWDDSVHWLSAKGQAYFEGQGRTWQALRLVGTFMDVNARKAAEEQIRIQNEQLERLVAERTAQIEKLERQKLESEKQVVVGRMAARIAHEINNPLAGVGMSFKLVKKALPPDHPNNQYVERIEKELGRIATIVRQMFELYRPEPHEPERFVAADAIRDVVKLLEHLSRTQEVTVELDIAEAEHSVHLHEDSLKQAIFNLLQNAIEASPRGGTIWLAAKVDDNTLHISLADQGSGIPEEAKVHIFEPFYTTKDYLTTGGLGLGLPITRTLVETIGGTIDFEPSTRGGTVFHVTLPFAMEAP